MAESNSPRRLARSASRPVAEIGGMIVEDSWILFMARIALLPELSDSEPSDPQDAQDQIRHMVEEEGGRVQDFFWSVALRNLGGDASALRLIALFDARSQYVVWTPAGPAFDNYVRPPEVVDDDMPLGLDPYAMAQSIRDAVNRTGRFLVTDMEEWTTGESLTQEVAVGQEDASHTEPLITVTVVDET